ncbi:DEKNAAC100853 [Brettanomyces naardenensis]|uniref:DNA-directed RNA polymerase subunit n=1 Tax=Brettanomyces naardenensis TaxID=13370 RepID=A0A448YEM2_BRENA|nr:DEKNAAC100853 [Brettanomyces naardenensis]
MFQLSVLSDLTRIPPNLFSLPRLAAIKQELNGKYANKVIPKLGLVISVWDILEVEDGLLKPGDGAIYIKVRFRCILFRPFVGEVLTGWIESCSEDGIRVNMEFFNDIFIPKSLIFENSIYSPKENAWIWEMDSENRLYLDVNEKINFRVEEEVFNDVKPKGPENPLSVYENVNGDAKEEKANATPPYALVASCQTDGMGCVSWW